MWLIQALCQAEALTSADNSSQTHLSPEEAAKLIHELKVHQIELQMQNEEMRRSQEELIHSRDRFGVLFNHAPVGYLVVDANGTIAETNETFCRMVGLDIKLVKGRGLHEFMISADSSTFLSRFRSFFKHPEGKNMELGLVSQSGIPIFVQISATIFSVPNSRHSMPASPHLLVAISDTTERKTAEEKLFNANWRLESIIDGTHVGTWEWNVQTGETVFNEEWAKIIGYTLDELSPVSIQTWERFADPDDMKLSAELLNRHFSGELPYYDCECRMKHKSGDWVWVHDRGQVINRTADGKPLMMFGTHADITERKAAEKALRESEEKYRVLFHNELYAICIFDLEALRFLDVNDAYVKLYGYSKSELLENLTIHDVTVQHQESDRATKQAVSAGTIYIPLRYHKKKDGTVFPVEIVGGPYTWKGKKVMFAISRDIGERIQAETALKASKQAYDKLVAQVPVGIYKLRMKVNGGMVFDYVSPRFCEMMHIDGHDVMKNPQIAFDCIHPEDLSHLLETNETARKTGKGFQWEGRVVIGDDIRFLHMESLPERMENGDIVWTGTQRDITDEKRLEAERNELEYRLQQARKTESLGRMAGAIAHNFNNQLFAVLGNLEMAMMELPHDTEAAISINEAQKAAKKAARISGLMLTYLGQGLGKSELLNMSEICRLGLAQLMESIPTGITLTSNLLSHGPIIKADSQQIQLILTNLVTNAWEAIGNNQGNIVLSVRTFSGGNIPLTHRFPADWQPQASLYACMEVTDTGCGIRKEDIEKICDPFYSTKFTGRGLGLSGIIGIVCAYDGGITVESQPDRGSTFRIYLPTASE